LIPLKGDGSSRCFFRMKSGNSLETFIVMSNPPVDKAALLENLAYHRIGRHLKSRGVPVPEIYYADHQRGCIVLEDLGDTSLQEYIVRLDDPLPVFEKVLDVLLHLQYEGVEGFDPRWCCQTPRYDRTVMVLLEACYFREAFLRGYMGVTEDLGRLERCFLHCAEVISGRLNFCLLHRDFQSRNIMISNGRIRIIDWQSSRLGPPGYDLASLVIDPYTGLNDEHRTFLIETYLAKSGEKFPFRAEDFMAIYPYLALQRNMQILGAFAYLSTAKGKKEFEVYIAPAFKRLKAQLEEMEDKALFPLLELVRGIKGASAGKLSKNKIDTRPTSK
jgi:N-acetylmuramate 1-kinase